MKLGAYLQKTKTSPELLALAINVTAVSVRRYISGKRKPRPEIMERIKQATGGKVTANDFYAEAQQ